MKSFIFFFLLPTLLLSQELQTRTQALMGTFVHISLPSQYNTQISQSFNLIRKIEHSLSSYDSEALIYTLNHTHKVKADSYLLEAIEKSKAYYKQTQGYFDITIGSITKDLYHFGEENSTIPTQKALKEATLNIDAIEMNASNITTAKHITIDLGGMGKGYAVDKVADFLAEQNISQGTIALSGDIRCLDLCDFALQSPFSEQTFAHLRATIPNLSISTSGTYRRYIKDTTHNHLINPKTATQGKAFVSVSLFTKANNAKIDAYATAISVMPREKALVFLKEHDEIGFVLVESSGKIVYGNLEKFVSLKWIGYKEKATIPNSSKKTTTKTPIETSLIHPDTTNPNIIGK